jgi:hypothetical protein
MQNNKSIGDVVLYLAVDEYDDVNQGIWGKNEIGEWAYITYL